MLAEVSSVVHLELSWLCAQPLARRRDRILVSVAGVLPDLDGLSALGGIDAYARWHHRLTHGYPAALATGVLCAVLAHDRVRTTLLGLFTFHLHLACDLLGSGAWSILYFWPTSEREWFWGGSWELASWQNAVIGVAATALCLAGALWWGRTVVEVFSRTADAAVVKALRARFGARGAGG
jgi:hypothetical protein